MGKEKKGLIFKVCLRYNLKGMLGKSSYLVVLYISTSDVNFHPLVLAVLRRIMGVETEILNEKEGIMQGSNMSFIRSFPSWLNLH